MLFFFCHFLLIFVKFFDKRIPTVGAGFCRFCHFFAYFLKSIFKNQKKIIKIRVFLAKKEKNERGFAILANFVTKMF